MSNAKKDAAEKIEVDVQQALRREISEQNPSKEPFTGDFTDEQKQMI